MRSASDILAKAAIADLTDWNQWYRHAPRCVMLRPWFRGGCHACFCRPDGWVPSVLVLCKHEVSPWLPKRTARSAPPSFSPPSRKLPPAAAQKFQMAYRLMFDCEQLQTPLLDAQMALSKLRLCDLFWVATGMDGVRRRRRGTARGCEKKRHVFSHPHPPRRPGWTRPNGANAEG